MSATKSSVNFEAARKRLDGEIDDVSLEVDTKDQMHYFDDQGNGATLIDGQSEGIEVSDWDGEEGSIHISEDGLNYSGYSPDERTKEILKTIVLGNFETDIISEVSLALQETYDQIMEDGERSVDIDEAKSKVEDVADFANRRMSEEDLKFTNLRYKGGKNDLGDIILSYGDEDADYGPFETGPCDITIRTGQDHNGYSSTVIAYEIGMRLLQDSDRKPEVSTGWAYKDKDHHRTQKDQANPHLRDAFN